MFCVYADKDLLAEFYNESQAIECAMSYLKPEDCNRIEVWECYITSESDDNGTWLVRNKVELFLCL